jgi:hypothetical protein
MGSSANRLRKKWQDYSGQNAGAAEKNFFECFNALFKDTEYRIRRSPKEFSNIYVKVKLSKQTQAEIYVPTEAITRHGVFPDYAIDNTETGKTIYIEVKRQDGWVEGKKRSAGRGNAHERSSKFFTPGLQKVLRKHGKLGNDILPFWTVFLGDITRDPCRVREITLWFDDYTDHYFFWRNSQNADPLVEHFIKRIKPLLS